MRPTRLFALIPLALALLAPAAARADDTSPPEITHTPVEKADKGKSVRIQAKITDQSKFFPQVFYRWDGGAYAKALDMKKVTGKKAPKDMYQASVPGKGDVLEYYIEAYDEFGNGPARSGSPESPHKVEATAAAVAEAPKEEPKVEPTKAEEPAAVAQTEPAPAAEPAKVEEPPAEQPKAEEPKVAEKKTPKSAPKAATTTPAVASASEGGRTWTWVVGGTGAGLLVGGLLTGLAVKKADDAFAARAQDKQNNPVTLQQQYDANKSLGSTATMMTIGGVVLMAGGTALYFFEPGWLGGGKHAENEQPQDAGKLRFAAAPVEGGAAALVAGRF
jgi:hypothetical protein